MHDDGPRFALQFLRNVCLVVVAFAASAQAATLPAGFTESLVASGLNNPTAMQFAPDGRLFVCEQGGRLRVIKNGALLRTPFLTVTVSSSGERGLLGVAFDPDFAVNQFVYVYYTATTPGHPQPRQPVHRQRRRRRRPAARSSCSISRTSSATNHNGGALAFGPDGKLYVAVGENAVASNAQSLSNRLGKILRINKDGTIPTDNPFFTHGDRREPRDLGARPAQPVHVRVQAAGTVDVHQRRRPGHVGGDQRGRAGANYGWPDTEGPTTRSAVRHAAIQLRAYRAAPCAIAGGAFYSPVTAQFPADYLDDYFFADYCAGWIRRLDPATATPSSTFATGIASPVDLKVADDGSLYYLARGDRAAPVYRIAYGATAPTITSHPASRTSRRGVGHVQRARHRDRRRSAISGSATAPISPARPSQDYTIASVAPPTTARGSARSSATTSAASPATRRCSRSRANRAPTATITQPAAGTLYSGAQVDHLCGHRRPIPKTARCQRAPSPGRWTSITMRTRHPFVAADERRAPAAASPSRRPARPQRTSGIDSISRSATRAALTHTVQRDIMPRKVALTLATNPAGLQLRLDGQPVTTPVTFDGVVGIVRSLEAPTSQASGGTTYEFVSWSDGGAATHTISDARRQHDLYGDVSRGRRRRHGHRPVGDLLRQHRLHRHDRVADRSDRRLHLGLRLAGAGIGADTFSARWTGQVEAPFSGTYTFYTVRATTACGCG